MRAYFYDRLQILASVNATAPRHAELIMTKERGDTLDQGTGAYITMPHYAYEYKCTLGVATINAGRRAAGSLNSALLHVHVVVAEQRK